MNSESKCGMLAWVLQVISGAVLVGTIALHWYAQHMAADGGLLDYSQVVTYLREPGVMALEISFLIAAFAHALLGLRAIFLDLGPGRRLEVPILLGLALAGAGMIAYGIDLTLGLVR